MPWSEKIKRLPTRISFKFVHLPQKIFLGKASTVFPQKANKINSISASCALHSGKIITKHKCKECYEILFFYLNTRCNFGGKTSGQGSFVTYNDSTSFRSRLKHKSYFRKLKYFEERFKPPGGRKKGSKKYQCCSKFQFYMY